MYQNYNEVPEILVVKFSRYYKIGQFYDIDDR